MATEPRSVTVDVWVARPSRELPGHADLLDEREQRRRAELRRAEDRARFTVATAVVKLVAGQRLGRPAGQVVIDRGCPDCDRWHGRPRLPGTGLAVSLSHSGDRVLVALTGGPPVGVDVERIAPVDTAALSKLVLAAGEQAETLPAFYDYWTRKEAVVKATGDGLRTPLREVVVSPPGEPPRLLRYADRDGLLASLATLAVGDGYAAAVAVLAPGPLRVVPHDAAPLLAAAG